MISSKELVALLAEPERRRVAAALILAASDVGEIVKTTGLTHREATDALERLTSAGLVEVGADSVYVLLEEAFKLAARSDAQVPSATTDQPEHSETERLLEKWIVNGRLVHLPRKRSKRLIVLDHMVQSFEPGTRYSERQVNSTLRSYDEDVATLRRYLVDEGFLDRADGEYWRSGGTVNTPC